MEKKISKAQERFVQRYEEITITLIPQCVKCKNSRGFDCLVYGKKPLEYLKNKKDCPDRELDSRFK